ncbi:unnamed protein product [Adineta steineri]|uniref:Uncharacterized protein n=2 Tax=Adineta steineri TaxID=433720 RepID=A0A819ET98_9BILA|nr:unnamed protein product [Adineta steineri]CAF3855899.1 unnamed protein product [Adineta steineri]
MANLIVTDNNHAGFIAVHIGAGLQSQARLPQYRETIKRACLQGIKVLNSGKNASEAACIAVAVLEDCPLTNAGIGSNLTLDGNIECDASIMDEDSYGAIGAVSGIQNPITLAWALLHTQKQGLMDGGRIPPCLLVGDGAKQWAQETGIPLIDSQQMKTENSTYMFEKYKRKLDDTTVESTKKLKTNDNERLDTVGAIVIDRNGNVAAAASSGGILLKHSGRVGHSAMFGCGCWAERNDACSVAIASSGTGEFLMKSLFSKSICDACSFDDLTPETIRIHLNKIFLNRIMTPINADKYFGFILLKMITNENQSRLVEFLCAHNTQTMFIGYMTTNQSKVTTVFSELKSNDPLSINIDSIHLT